MSADRVIVFGDDGSAGAEDAWRWINEQGWRGWRLEVVTVHLPPIGPPPSPAQAQPHSWEPPTPRRPSPQTHFAGVRHLVAQADPRLVLWRPDADVVVIGPRGTGLLKRLHLGSTAEYLLHHPAAPFVIARAPRAVRRAVLCVDGSTHADRAAQALAEMPWIEGAIVEVLGIEERNADLDGVAERATALLSSVGAKPEVRRGRGAVASTILREVEDVEADLVAMGSRGLSGLTRLAAGSVASAVARAAPCSVLVAGVADATG